VFERVEDQVVEDDPHAIGHRLRLGELVVRVRGQTNADGLRDDLQQTKMFFDRRSHRQGLRSRRAVRGFHAAQFERRLRHARQSPAARGDIANHRVAVGGHFFADSSRSREHPRVHVDHLKRRAEVVYQRRKEARAIFLFLE
jgi:hypothetical protein